MTTERCHSHMWDRLSPEARAAIERELAKLRPVEEWDREHRRRLAALLGLRPHATAATNGRASDA